MKSDIPHIRILAGFLVVASIVFGQNAYAATAAPIRSNTGNRAAVEKIFGATSPMISVAQCESGFQQYTAKGATFTGSRGQYVGVFQISKGHIPTAKKLGFDIYTLEGNLGYAKYMYDRQGLGPWKGCVKGPVASKKPVQKKTVAPAKAPLLTKNMRVGTKDAEVIALQKILNTAGFFVARSGAGSLGHETKTFDTHTREALKRFQCIKNIACKGTEASTGYGRVGPLTRAALLKEAKKQGM